MDDNSTGTEIPEVRWDDLSDPVQAMVLARIRSMIVDTEIDVADEQVKMLAMKHTIASAYGAVQNQLGHERKMPEEMAKAMAAMQDELNVGMTADRQLLLKALVASFNHLQGQPEQNSSSIPSLALGSGSSWQDLCEELSLEPTTATPEDVIAMVRRLKARLDPDTPPNGVEVVST